MRYEMLEARAIRVPPVDTVPVEEARSIGEPLRLPCWGVGNGVVLTATLWQIGQPVAALDPIAHGDLQCLGLGGTGGEHGVGHCVSGASGMGLNAIKTVEAWRSGG